jgi:hypothetical protein
MQNSKFKSGQNDSFWLPFCLLNFAKCKIIAKWGFCPHFAHFTAGQNLTGKTMGQNDSFCSLLNLEFCAHSKMVNF